jgi:hypothetical protein
MGNKLSTFKYARLPLELLERRIENERAVVSQDSIQSAIDQWKRRVQAAIKISGVLEYIINKMHILTFKV